MASQAFVDALANSSNGEQALLLSLLGHELTIVARTAYEFQGPGVTDPRLLRDLNEIQHRLHGQIFSLLRNSAPAFPPDALAWWLSAEGKPHLQNGLAHAFQRTLHRYGAVH